MSSAKQTLTELLQVYTKAELLKIMGEIIPGSSSSTVKDFVIENDGFNGSFTFGDDETLSWYYSNYQKCCEKAYVEYDSQNINGKTITDYELDFTGGNEAHLNLTFSDGSIWCCRFYNNHNGYYTHNLTIYVNGNEKWNVAI